MTEFDDLLKLSHTNYPKNFKPGSQFDGVTGHITTPPRDSEPTPEEWDHILRLNGYDPEKYYVVGKVGHSTNVRDDGTVAQTWYKAQIALKPERSFDVDALVEYIRSQPEPAPVVGHGKHRVIFLTDQHVGKSEGEGGGSEDIARAWKLCVNKALEGGPFETVHVAMGGDTIEGYVSQNGANIAGTDLDLRESINVASELLTDTILQARRVAQKITVSVVPGNHGETTRVQKRPMSDSYDLLIVEGVQRVCKYAGLDNVEFFYPEKFEGDLLYRVGPAVIHQSHGHLLKGQLPGFMKYVQGFVVNGHPCAQATIFLVGHFHNFLMQNFAGDKWVIFGASLENQSTWFKNSTGFSTQRGVVFFDITADGQPPGVTLAQP